MQHLLPRQNPSVVVTPDDHGPLIAVATWFCMVIVIISILIRLAIRMLVKRTFALDDVLIIVAMMLGMGQSIGVSVAIQNGLGKYQDLLNTTQLQSVDKALYANDLLYILSLSLSKISVLELLQGLAVVDKHKTIAKWTSYFVGIWTLAIIIPPLFRCSLPQVWNSQSNNCINMEAFWICMAPVDILIELVLLALPIVMMSGVQVKGSKKMVVIGAFAFRVFVIFATAIRLYFITSSHTDPDQTFAIVNTEIATQCVLSISIITACIPCLKPFLDAFESGMLNAVVRNPSGQDSQNESYLMYGRSKVHESVLRSQACDEEVKGLGHSAAAFAESRPPVHHGRTSPRRENHFDPWTNPSNNDKIVVTTEYEIEEHSETGTHRTQHSR